MLIFYRYSKSGCKETKNKLYLQNILLLFFQNLFRFNMQPVKGKKPVFQIIGTIYSGYILPGHLHLC